MGVAVLIDQPGYRLAADRKILKADEAIIVANVAEAYAQAQRQIAGALQQIERLKAQTLEQAHRDGLARAAKEAAQRLLITEADRHALLKSSQPALADVVLDAITLLARNLDRKALAARALEVLQGALREASWARIRVHPNASDVTQSALDEFQQQTGLGRLARITTDDALPEDGCVIESEFGKVDVSLDTQLETIRGAILHAVRQSALE